MAPTLPVPSLSMLFPLYIPGGHVLRRRRGGLPTPPVQLGNSWERVIGNSLDQGQGGAGAERITQRSLLVLLGEGGPRCRQLGCGSRGRGWGLGGEAAGRVHMGGTDRGSTAGRREGGAVPPFPFGRLLLIELIPGPRATRRASPACTRDALNCLKILLGVFPSEFSQMVPLCPDHHVSVFCFLCHLMPLRSPESTLLRKPQGRPPSESQGRAWEDLGHHAPPPRPLPRTNRLSGSV